MASLIFYAHYIASKQGKTGLAVTIDVHRITRSSGSSSEIVTGSSATEVGDGLYRYLLSDADITVYDYAVVFKTSDTSVDQQHIPALWTRYGMSSDVYSFNGAVVESATQTGLVKVRVDAMSGNVITADSIASDAIGSDQLAAGAVTKIQDGLALQGADSDTLETLSDQLDVIQSDINALDVIAFPSGAVEYTYTLTALGLPVGDADVWISTDLAGKNVIWRGTTDIFGVARDVKNNKPLLDPGTYYIWIQKSGYTPYSYPDIEVVS